MNNRILWILRTIFTSGFLGALTAQALLIIDSLGRDGLSRPPLLALVLVFVVGFGLIQFVIIAMVVALAHRWHGPAALWHPHPAGTRHRLLH